MGRLSGRGALVVWIDLHRELEEEADRWYEQEHFPERITESGYLRARRFLALAGEPGYMGILEAETPEALASEGYKRVTQNINERSRRMRNAFRRIIRSPHTVLASTGTIDGAVMLCARIAFATDAERAAFARWGATEFAPWVKQFPQVLAGHALAAAPDVRKHMDSFRASGQQDESSDGVILLEFGRASEANAMAPRLGLEGLRGLGIRARESLVTTYQLMFDIVPGHFRADGSGGAR